MARRFLITAGAVTIVFILFFTLSEQVRPHLFLYRSMDRVFAFGAAGFIFGTAYPRHASLALIYLVIFAIGSELFQYLRPTRDPRLFDGIAKVAGSAIGVGAAYSLSRLWPSLAKRLA